MLLLWNPEVIVLDVLYILIAVLFFAATWRLAKVCDRL